MNTKIVIAVFLVISHVRLVLQDQIIIVIHAIKMDYMVISIHNLKHALLHVILMNTLVIYIHAHNVILHALHVMEEIMMIV